MGETLFARQTGLRRNASLRVAQSERLVALRINRHYLVPKRRRKAPWARVSLAGRTIGRPAQNGQGLPTKLGRFRGLYSDGVVVGWLSCFFLQPLISWHIEWAYLFGSCGLWKCHFCLWVIWVSKSLVKVGPLHKGAYYSSLFFFIEDLWFKFLF